MLKAITRLIQIKKIIALIMTGTFVTLALYGQIAADEFQTIFLIVVSFYFGQSTARQTQIEAHPKEGGLDV